MSQPNCDRNHCGACCGGACGGCGRQIELTDREISLLRELGTFAFLPFAARADGSDPVCRSSEDGEPEYGPEIVSLRVKGLIRAEHDVPLSGCDYGAYPDRPAHGSMELTRTGQEALDALDRQGAE